MLHSRGFRLTKHIAFLNEKPQLNMVLLTAFQQILTNFRNTVQLFIVAGTFHVPQPQQEQRFRSLADGTRSVPATF